jgi:hypothetical protein
LTNEIIYTNLAAKPKLLTPAPTPAPIAQAQAPQVKRITWGIHGRLHIPATTERPQPRKDDSSAPRVRPSRGKARVERSPEAQTPEAPKVRLRFVDRGSRLEQLPGQRLLAERLDRQAAQPALEHLTILHSPKAQGYWIADAETGEVFLSQAFATLKHCYDAAAELERRFAMAQVLEMRMPETMESVGELVREHWLRERVAVALG